MDGGRPPPLAVNRAEIRERSMLGKEEDIITPILSALFTFLSVPVSILCCQVTTDMRALIVLVVLGN